MLVSKTFALTAACTALIATPALARHHAHNQPRYAAAGAHPPSGYARPRGERQGYGALYETPGGAVAAAAARAQTEPGVTQELSPDARQSATGGPSGGVPGFSGGM